MATVELKTDTSASTNGEPAFTLCTFCNNSTSGFEKRLFATTQPKGPFFPVLADVEGRKTSLDDLGRAVVCVACFHHLLRQWSSFERRSVPLRKREYNIISDDRVNNYQVRREEEIRKEAEHKIKEIQDREERIRLEAEERIEKYRQRQAEIRREAEKKLLEEQSKAEELKKKTSSKLKEEHQREEELRRQAEERIQEEKEKREYIRQEAERLLREEKLLEAQKRNQDSVSSAPEIITRYRTEVIIPSPERENAPLKEITDQTESDDMESGTEKERPTRNQGRKMMVYDPETGCYRKAQDDDKENTVVETKTEKVEYRFHLRSDEKPRKTTEAKDASSKPDKASEDVTVSMEAVQYSTEQTIVLNGKERSRSQGRDGDAKDEEEDIKRAGDIMKAKFEEGRKRFEQEPVERKRSDSSRQRTTRTTSDDSLEEKIKEMEKRRERLLLRGPSSESMEIQGRRPSEERKDLSPKVESPRDGSKSPVDDTTKKQRSRSERNKRRLTAEGLSLKKSSGSEEDLTTRTAGADAVKVPKTDPQIEERQTETEKERFTFQVERSDKPDIPDDPVVMTQVKTVEADLMNWDDSTDGLTPSPGFRKRADSAEGEMFPRSIKLVEIEAPITVSQKGEVESEPVLTTNLLDLDETTSMTSAPAIEPISTWDSRARASNTAEEDRRRREMEHEERKRKIEENQRRAAKELKAKKQSESDAKPQGDEPVREMTMKEKRRSLVDMWESFSEPQTNVMSFEEDEDMPESKTTIIREKRTVLFDPLEDKGNEKAMEVGEIEVITATAPSVEAEKNTNLTEEEQRWESAGHFQPGRLQKTVFHNLSETQPEQPIAKPRTKVGSRYDWMKGETSDDQAALVPTKLKIDWQSSPAADEKLSNSQARERSPEPIQMEIKTESRDVKSSSDSESERESERGNDSESESRSEEERVPRVDTDEVHKLTEEEKQWELAGHFQPKKLNIALMVGFQQAPAHVEEKPAPRKTQTTPVPAELKVKEPEKIEVISPVSEVKTETEPDTSVLYTYTYEEESDDDEIPGWRKVEEQRRQQEREEIERAKLEEKRRMEREALEQDQQEEADSSDDEFEAKVRTKEIRRINPNLLGQFLKEPAKEPEKSHRSIKLKEQKIDRASVQVSESAPVVDTHFDEIEKEREREVEDEYEEKVKSKQITKLKIDTLPFLQAQEQDTFPAPHRDVPRASRIAAQEERYVQNVQRTTVESAPRKEWKEEQDESEINTYGASTVAKYEDESEDDDDVPEWRKMEERRKRQEQEEIARARLEEQRRLEREAQEAEEQDDSDSVDDEFEAKVRTKEIRRINPNLLVQFMSENKGEVPITRRPKKETIETHRVLVTETAPRDENNLKDSNDEDVVDEDDDEFELKVKKGQVGKLILGNSPFLQQQKKEDVPVARKRSDAEKNSKESKKDSRTPVVQEDVLVRVVHDEVVESQPDMIFPAEEEDEGYEVKIKSKDVRKLSHNQFLFLRQQEEEERKRLQEEERRRIEREERELRKKEEERRRRLEAEAQAREEERIRREEETRKREEEERARKEEEKRRRLEEAERLRREEEERLQKEEEDELMRLEEMRRQKQAAKLKFESGSFDGVSVSRTENDIYSVGRLDTNKLLQFQQSPREEPKVKSKPRVEQKKKDEYKLPEPEVETVQMTSVDLIESSPYEGDLKRLPTEDEMYEEKRKSVGKLDREWYIKQQERQAEENERRAKELEEERLREERNEMLRIKGEGSQRQEDDDSRGSLVYEESLNVDTDEAESEEPKNVGKLNYQQFSMFQKEGSVAPKAQPRKKAPEVVQEVVGFRSQQDVEGAPVNMDESDSYHGGPSVTQEDSDYEKRINTGKRLDVDRFLNARSQEAAQRTERAKRMAEERKRQEEEELAKLRFEERRRMEEEVDSDYVESGRSQASDSRRKSGSSTESDPERPRRILIETEPSRPKESDTETERMDKGVSVGRLPHELRSQFEGGKTKTDADSRRKSSKSKGSRSSSRNSMESPHSTSNDSVSDVPHDKGMNGGISPKDKSLEMKYSVDRGEESKEMQEEDTPIETYTPEEKPVPKKLHTSMLAAFEKVDSDPVQLRRAKSEKRVRPKSIGNVDLLRWQDDSSLHQPSSASSQKGKSGRQPRPKSIAF